MGRLHLRSRRAHIVDLNTGRCYVVYSIKVKENFVGEFMNQIGQLSWIAKATKE